MRYNVLARQPVKGYIFGLIIRLRGHAVCSKPFFNLRNKVLNPLVVQTEHGHAVKGYLVDEIEKHLFDLFQVPIEIEVFSVDVRYYTDGRGELQERAIAFVGFSYNEFSLAQTGVRSQAVELSSDDHRRIEAPVVKDRSNDPRRCGLAMGTSHSDAVFQPH